MKISRYFRLLDIFLVPKVGDTYIREGANIRGNTVCLYWLLWSYLFRGPSDETVGPSLSFTIETDVVSLTEWSDRPPKSSITRTTPGWSFSMIKYTDGPTVLSRGPRNKYDPGLSKEPKC